MMSSALLASSAELMQLRHFSAAERLFRFGGAFLAVADFLGFVAGLRFVISAVEIRISSADYVRSLCTENAFAPSEFLSAVALCG